jgi:effector-binding domain-containing protein
MYRGYEIKEVDIEKRYFVMKRKEVSFDNIQQFYAQNLGSLFGSIQSVGLEMKGMPCGLYFSYDEIAQKTDMAAAIPVKKDIRIDGVANHTIPAGKAIQLDYRGDYNNLSLAHTAIDEYMKDRSLFTNPPVVEEYITDPGQEEDPEQWLTKISYYISAN